MAAIEFGEQLGTGAFGAVYSGRFRGIEVAVKCSLLEGGGSEAEDVKKSEEEILHEITLHRQAFVK